MALPPESPRQIRSYHRAFHFELTLYSLGRIRLIRPIPARAILYLAVLEAVMAIVAHLPVIGVALSSFGWFTVYGLIPVSLAWLLTEAKIEGRRFHLALRVWSNHWLAPKRLAGAYRPIAKPGGRWRPSDIVFISDGRCGAPPQGLSLKGPGKIGLRYPCEAHQRGTVLTVRQLSNTPQREPKVVTIADGATVRFVGMKGATQ